MHFASIVESRQDDATPWIDAAARARTAVEGCSGEIQLLAMNIAMLHSAPARAVALQRFRIEQDLRRAIEPASPICATIDARAVIGVAASEKSTMRHRHRRRSVQP